MSRKTGILCKTYSFLADNGPITAVAVLWNTTRKTNEQLAEDAQNRINNGRGFIFYSISGEVVTVTGKVNRVLVEDLE